MADMKGDRPGSRSGEIRSLLRRPGFRYLYIAQTASVVGDAIIPIALAFAVLQLTGSPAALGLVLAARILPTVVLLLIGGVIADRLPRRAVMMASDLTRFGSQALAGVLLLTGDANLASMIVLQLVAGTAAAFFQPASSGLLPEVVPAKDLQPANGLIQLSENFAWTLGPALGGLLVALVSPGAALIFDGVTFLISAIALWMLKVDRRAPSVQENPSILRELRGVGPNSEPEPGCGRRSRGRAPSTCSSCRLGRSSAHRSPVTNLAGLPPGRSSPRAQASGRCSAA